MRLMLLLSCNLKVTSEERLRFDVQPVPREILICQTDDGREPFTEWLNGELDPATRGRVRARIDRIEDGNFGDVSPVGAGLSELRLDFGAGYRVYFGQKAMKCI
jgi:putative addiction module killer protein